MFTLPQAYPNTKGPGNSNDSKGPGNSNDSKLPADSNFCCLLSYQGIFYKKLPGAGLAPSIKQKFTSYTDTEILNPNFSATLCIQKESSQSIINFLGNTAPGSSGGILIDSQGDLIGVNFGYFPTDARLEPNPTL